MKGSEPKFWPRTVPDARRLIVAAAVLLGLSLTLFRWQIVAPDSAGLLPVAAAADLAVVWLLALLFLWCAGRGAHPRAWAWGWVALTVMLAATGLGNVTAVRMLNGPVTLQWLQFADVFNSSYMIGIVLGALSPVRVLAVLLAVALWALAALSLAWLGARWPSEAPLRAGRRLLPVAPALALGLVAAGAGDLGGRAQNPLAALLTSVIMPPDEMPDLTLLTGAASGKSRNSIADIFDAAAPFPRPHVPEGSIRNVVIFTLESAGAAYVHGYDPALEITPVIAGLAPSALKVTDVYAHAPASGYARLSLYGGVVPQIAPYSVHKTHPDLKFDGLARVMGRAGFRTGYFSTTDNRFQGNGDLVARTGFETVTDLHDWSCRLPIEPGGSADAYIDTANDLCAVDPVLDWIDRDPDAPFLAAVWTGMTHYPYYPGPEPRDLVPDPMQNKYLNALIIMDQALGQLIEGLRERSLLEQTLIVIHGDHGEAFGEHGQLSHATEIYEENLHVPLYLVHGGIFKGETAELIAGLSDVAPTIADLLGIPPSPDWQGWSLFAADRPDGVLFFTAWNDLQIGLREGATKLVVNANTGATRLTDLVADPGERMDISQSEPERLERARRKLADLVTLQDRYYRALTSDGADVAGNAATRKPGHPTDNTVTIRAGGTWFQHLPRVKVRLDGATLGEIALDNALSNATASVAMPENLNTGKDYSLSSAPAECPRKIEIEFLNDDWAGEGHTGDNNVFVSRAEFRGETYYPFQFSVTDPKSGNVQKSAAYLYRPGVVEIALLPTPDCIAADLVSVE